MTQTEYAEAHKELRKQEISISKQKDELFESYRAEHRKFNVLDKVRLTITHFKRGDETFDVFVSGCGVHEDGEIYYQFKKAKKDGTPSLHRFYSYDKIKSIELLEPRKNFLTPTI